MLLHVSDMTDRSDSNTYSDTGHTDRVILVEKHAGGNPTSPEKEQKMSGTREKMFDMNSV